MQRERKNLNLTKNEVIEAVSEWIPRLKYIGLVFVTSFIFSIFVNPYPLAFGLQYSLSAHLFHAILAYAVPQFTILAISPFEAFIVDMNIALVISICVTMPLFIYYLAEFVNPGLHENERRFMKLGILPVFLLFVSGALFGLFVVVRFLFGFSAVMDVCFGIGTTVSASQFLSTFMLMILMPGFAFELPAIMVYLTLFGIGSYSLYRKYWYIGFIVSYLISTMVSPPGVGMDVAMGLILFGLYLGGMYTSRFIERKKGVNRNVMPS